MKTLQSGRATENGLEKTRAAATLNIKEPAPENSRAETNRRIIMEKLVAMALCRKCKSPLKERPHAAPNSVCKTCRKKRKSEIDALRYRHRVAQARASESVKRSHLASRLQSWAF